MLQLDESVNLVLIQFSFANANAIPAWLRTEMEAFGSMQNRKGQKILGTLAIPPLEQCSLETLPTELKVAGWLLFDAYHQERINPKNTHQTYQTIRFLFSKEGPRTDLGKDLERMEDALTELCLSAFWRVRAFQNPFFQDNQPVEGKTTASVNLEARVPRFTPNGDFIKHWLKDGQGERIGNAPLPIEPTRRLRLQDNTLQLL